MSNGLIREGRPSTLTSILVGTIQFAILFIFEHQTHWSSYSYQFRAREAARYM